LEGIAKHNGPLIAAPEDVAGLPWAIRNLDNWQRLELDTFAGPEAQVAAIADDIAYNNHDIDDGLRAGLFSVRDICEVPIVGRVFADVARRYPDISEDRLIHEAVRDLIGFMVSDVLAETRQRLSQHNPQNARDFLYENMYKHYKVNRMMGQATRVVSELFELFITDPEILPTDLRRKCDGPKTTYTARVICDYIAGMTDTFAIAEHKKLFSVTGYL